MPAMPWRLARYCPLTEFAKHTASRTITRIGSLALLAEAAVC
jgi:hypothetical protein